MLGGDELDEHVDGEQILDVLDLWIGSKGVNVRVGQSFTELGQSVLGDDPVGGQSFSLGREVLGKQFASLDLDIEFLFEVEDDVEEINRFGSEIPDESRRG